MIEPIVELKVLLRIISHDELSPQQKEASKKRIKELIMQLKIDVLQKDFQ